MPGIRELGSFYRFTNTSLGNKLACWDGNVFDTTKHKYQDVYFCLSEGYFLEERILRLIPPILSSHRPWHQPCMCTPTLLTTDLSCTAVPCSSWSPCHHQSCLPCWSYYLIFFGSISPLFSIQAPITYLPFCSVCSVHLNVLPNVHITISLKSLEPSPFPTVSHLKDVYPFSILP